MNEERGVAAAHMRGARSRSGALGAPRSVRVGSGAKPRLSHAEDMSSLARFVRRGAGVPDGPMKG